MQREIESYVNHMKLVGLDPSWRSDPTIPFYNDFYVLGLDEGLSDDQIVSEAQQVYKKQADKVDRIGRAQGDVRFDAALRATIVQAGQRFANRKAVKDYRVELNRLRARPLKEVAKALCDEGRWTEAQGREILEAIAPRLGVQPDAMAAMVGDAVKSAGLWQTPGTASPPSLATPSPATATDNLLFDTLAVAGVSIPFWLVLPILTLVVAWLDVAAGLACGVLLLACAGGLAWREHLAGHSRPTRNLAWGGAALIVALLPSVGSVVAELGGGMLSGLSSQVVADVEVAPASVAAAVPFGDHVVTPGQLLLASEHDVSSQALLAVADGDATTQLEGLGKGSELTFQFAQNHTIDGVAVLLGRADGRREVMLSVWPSAAQPSPPIRLDSRSWWQFSPLPPVDASAMSLRVEGGGATGVAVKEVWFTQRQHDIPEPAESWQRVWETNWGNMVFEVVGSWVKASSQSESAATRLEFFLRSRGRDELEGVWLRHPQLAPPNDAGKILLTLASDFREFSGYWEAGFRRDLDSLRDDQFKAAAAAVWGMVPGGR